MDKWKAQHVSWGAGYRLGFKPRGLFVEVAYLGYTTLNQVFIFTDMLPPTREGNKPILEHAWFLKKIWRKYTSTCGNRVFVLTFNFSQMIADFCR